MKTLIVLFFACGIATAQKVDYNTIILPKNAKEIEFPEKLVQLAWQNSPTSEILNHEVTSSNLRIKQSKFNWLDNFRITGNLNEFNINNYSEPNSLAGFYPRYNVSAFVSLGTIFTNPLKTKIEKQGLEINLQNINQQKLLIRSKVMSTYQVYLSNKEIFEIRSQIMEDLSSDFKLKEQNFARGEISLLEYNAILDRLNQQKINKVLAEKDFLISQIELEELIGMKLIDVR